MFCITNNSNYASLVIKHLSDKHTAYRDLQNAKPLNQISNKNTKCKTILNQIYICHTNSIFSFNTNNNNKSF